MNFENLHVGDPVKIGETLDKVIMIDTNRFVCDVDKCYITDNGAVEPVEISESMLKMYGYEKMVYDNKYIKEIRSTINNRVWSNAWKEDDTWKITICAESSGDNYILENVKVKWIQQILRLEEAFKIITSKVL